MRHLRTGLALSAFALLLPASSWASPRPLPFTYGTATNGKGESEIEQYVDLVPLYARDAQTGTPVRYLASQLQTELEYGLTDSLELGLYVTATPHLGDAFTSYPVLTEANGSKQRLRYRLADEGDWPVDVAVYGEVVENEREFELEAKLILQRRLGDWLLAGNLSAEYEIYYAGRREVVLDPSLGVTYQATPSVFPGLEYWVRGEINTLDPGDRDFNDGPHQYLGPTLRVSLSRMFITAGAYLRLDDFGHHLQVGDAFGDSWYRMVVGISL